MPNTSIDMKKVLILAVIAAMTSNMWGQQISMYSQYMFNDFVINPAVAGSEDYSKVGLSFRRQWAGMKDAPVTQTLSAHTFLGASMGAGLNIYNDVSGPTRRTGMSAAYSYHINTGDNSKLSFGLSAHLTQFILNRDQLITENPNDVAIMNQTNNELIPDFSFGLYWYGDKHFIGLSGFNLLESKNDLFDITTPVTNTLDRAIYANAGYKFEISESFKIEPSVLFRYMMNSPFQLDFNSRFILQDKYWIGVSYRTDDAIVAMLGFDLGALSIGYAYDYTLSDIQNYSSGSHEVFVGVKLFKGGSGKAPWHKRNRIYSSYSKGT
ncbi:MAG: type IX secretion system PorP/SprF family membrane protein [Parvicellaceae bacterium]